MTGGIPGTRAVTFANGSGGGNGEIRFNLPYALTIDSHAANVSLMNALS